MDIAKVVIFAVIIAAVATGIAFTLTYWYYFVGAGVGAFVVYALITRAKDKGNQV